MTKANRGFVADSGVQKHSAGDDYPITHHCVGGYPSGDNQAYWVVQHPAGTKRWCFTSEYRDGIIANFKDADAAIEGFDLNLVSERIAFELALLSIEKESGFRGHSFDKDGNPE